MCSYYIKKLDIIFKIWFLVYTMLSVCNFFYGKSIISYIMWPMIFLGCGLILWRIIHFKDYFVMPDCGWLIFMCASFLISMVWNYKFGLKDNIVTFVFWCFYFFLLYCRNKNDTVDEIKKEFNIISGLYLAYVNIGIIISLLMLMTGYQHVYTNQRGYEVAAGFIWGRLWGIFIDPNFASVMISAAICLNCYYWRKFKNKIVRLLLIVSCCLGILFIAFSDSRTGRVCLAVIVLVQGVIWILYFNKKAKLKYKIIITAGIICLSLFVSYLPKLTSNTYNYVKSITSEETTGKLVERGYDVESDVSNRRFDIWKSGIEIALSSPIVGTSFGGLRAYAEENLPETYIVNNDYKEFNTLDNELLNILAGQGIIGIIAGIGLIVTILNKIFSNILKLKKDEFLLVSCIVAIAASISASAMFRAAMFYHSSPNANLFWLLLGMAVFVSVNSGKVKENGK